jgi:hypothetical protein
LYLLTVLMRRGRTMLTTKNLHEIVIVFFQEIISFNFTKHFLLTFSIFKHVVSLLTIFDLFAITKTSL